MTKTRSIVTLAVAAALLLSPLAMGWGNDAHDEPSTVYDTALYMWQTPNDSSQVVDGAAPDRIYFNAFLDANDFRTPNVDGGLIGQSHLNGRLSPVSQVRPWALLGYWRDCNNDGYIGHRAIGSFNYPAAAAQIDLAVCPLGSAYNPGTGLPNGEVAVDEETSVDAYGPIGPMVYEWVPIGPDNRGNKPLHSFNDTEARVWGDISLPDAKAVLTKSITPLPYGTLDSWNGHLKYADDLTFNQVGNNYAAIVTVTETGAFLPDTIYDNGLDGTVPAAAGIAHRHYTGTEENGDQGRPMVRVWKCADSESNPEVNDAGDMFDSQGTLSDSVNWTAMGIWNRDLGLFVGQGCNGHERSEEEEECPRAGNTNVCFPTGTSLRRLGGRIQSTSGGNAPLKNKVDFFFSSYVVPWHTPSPGPYQMFPDELVPQINVGGIWRSGVTLLRPTTNPDEFGYGVTKANYWVFYARVNASLHSASALPGGAVAHDGFVYGEEACGQPLNPKDFSSPNGWDCGSTVGDWRVSPSQSWLSQPHAVSTNPLTRVWLGQLYHLRDVDCTDLTPAAPGTLTPLRKSASDAYVDAMTDAFGPTYPGPQTLFSSYC